MPSLRCTWPVFPPGVWKTLQRPYGAARVSASATSEWNKKAYVHIEDWRNRLLQGGRYPYVYVDGNYLSRNWSGEFENAAILAAIAVNEDGYREVLGATEDR